jgi:hypothetical protein
VRAGHEEAANEQQSLLYHHFLNHQRSRTLTFELRVPGDRRSLTVGQPWSELLEATAHGARTLPPTCLANGQQGRVTQRAVAPTNRAACVILWLADLRS